MAAGEILIRHMVEIAVGVGIMQRAMFAETFPIVSALHSMKHAVGAEVGGINQFAILIKVQAPGIAAAFTKKLETMANGMVAPNALLEFDATNVCSNGAALAAVEPAVR